jgi:thymidylate synthase
LDAIYFNQNQGVEEMEEGRAGSIPVILVSGRTLPEVWEKAVLRTWQEGTRARTQYDPEESPPSRDVTMIMVIESPLAEPRIHRSFPAGLEELEIYRQEVLYGVHDSWINPLDKRWSYTYHQRLFHYDIIGDFADSLRGGPFGAINQMENLINELVRCLYTRRAQAITWMPTVDPGHEDPPCLQRIWARILPGNDDEHLLNLNTHWRSRDAYKAAFMNLYALTDLQRLMAEEVSRKSGKNVVPGRHVDISDSFHIYGTYFEEFQKRFLALLEKRSFEERVWRTEDIADSLSAGKLQLINGKPGEPEIALEHKRRMYGELPPALRELVREDVRRQILP